MKRRPHFNDWTLGMFKLAERPCGTNAYECAKALGGTTAHASNNLRGLASSGHLQVVPEDRSLNRINQYFSRPEHAVAWGKTPEHLRQNPAYRDRVDAARKNHKKGRGISPPNRIQRLTWQRAPMVGDVNSGQKTVVRSQGIAMGYDIRFQCGPEFKGGELIAEWERLRGLDKS